MIEEHKKEKSSLIRIQTTAREKLDIVAARFKRPYDDVNRKRQVYGLKPLPPRTFHDDAIYTLARWSVDYSELRARLNDPKLGEELNKVVEDVYEPILQKFTVFSFAGGHLSGLIAGFCLTAHPKRQWEQFDHMLETQSEDIVESALADAELFFCQQGGRIVESVLGHQSTDWDAHIHIPDPGLAKSGEIAWQRLHAPFMAIAEQVRGDREAGRVTDIREAAALGYEIAEKEHSEKIAHLERRVAELERLVAVLRR